MSPGSSKPLSLSNASGDPETPDNSPSGFALIFALAVTLGILIGLLFLL